MTRSIHDNLLVSYEVRCKERAITLRTEHRAENKPSEFTNVIFDGVEGYRFENDAFGNIIFDVETTPVARLLTKYGAQISESYRVAGAPGAWAADLTYAPQHLVEQGVQGFILCSSVGLSGWVLAKKMSIVPEDEDSAIPQPRSGGR